MSSRQPFIGLPSGCDPLDFDINIVPAQFTFCSAPAVDALTAKVMTFNVGVPDIVAPPFCVCFPTVGVVNKTGTIILLSGDVRRKRQPLTPTNMPFVGLTIWKIVEDCCEMRLSMRMTIHVPCMPLSVTMVPTSTLLLKTVTKKPYFATRTTTFKKMDNSCALQLNLDLKVPCMPLEVTGTFVGSILKPGVTKLPILRRNKPFFTRRTDTCAIQHDMTLAIPCMPLGFDKSNYMNHPAPIDGNETFAFSMFHRDNCTLVMHAKLLRHGLSDCHTYVYNVKWESPNLYQYKREVCYKNGRAWKITDLDPQLVFQASNCD